MTTIATYEKVAEICDKMLANNEKLTVRAVHAQAGGGMATVLKHYNTWKSQQEIKNQAEGFSLELKTAIVSSLAQAKAEEQERLETVIQDLNEQVSDLSGHTTVLEEQLDEAINKIQATKNSLSNKIVELKEQLAAREGSADQAAKDAEKRESDLLGQIERIQQEKQLSIEQGEVARTELAKSQLQIERADSAAQKADSMLDEAKTEQKTLQGQIAGLEKEISKNQQEKAVALTQVANTKESLKDAHKQIVELKKSLGDQVKSHKADIKSVQGKLDLLDKEKHDLAGKLISAESNVAGMNKMEEELRSQIAELRKIEKK